jgi:CRP-like cAMP-binding protein
MTEPGPGKSRLLQLLSQADTEQLCGRLEDVKLKQGEVCITENQPIEYVYFLESGLGSSVFPDESRGTVEIGMQGYEGLIGVSALLGVDRSPHRVFMQVGGNAKRIGAKTLATRMDESPSMRFLLLRYAHIFLLQTAHTAHTNARFGLAERLARWLAMSADRLGLRLALTHDYLAYMLGTRRPGVTEGLHILEGEHLIWNRRGLILIRDLEGLRAMAGSSYGVPEAEYRRLIGPLP